MLDELMRQIVVASPSAAMYMAEKEWAKYSEDNFTQRRIMNDLYECMMEDFLEHGIEFTETLGDLFANDYWGNFLITIGKNLRDQYIVPFVTGHQEIIPKLIAVLEEDNEVDNVIMVLEIINGIKEDSVLTDAIEYISDKVKSTSVFDEYIQKVINASTLNLAKIVNPEKDVAVIHLIQYKREFLLNRIFPKLEPHFTIVNMPYIKKMMSRFGHRLVQEDHVSVMSLYLTADEKFRSVKFFGDFIYNYKSTSPFYIEYYSPGTGNDQSMDASKAVLLALGSRAEIFDSVKSPDQFVSELAGIGYVIPNNVLFICKKILNGDWS